MIFRCGWSYTAYTYLLAIENITITVKTFVHKGWWVSYGAETFRRQRVIIFLNLIILIATVKLANSYS